MSPAFARRSIPAIEGGLCPSVLEWTRESLQTYLVESLTPKLEEAASRLVELSEWEMFRIEGLTLSQNAKEFWRLIKDSYILGFDGPCIAFCRGAIEDVLRGKIGDEIYEKHLGERAGLQSEFSLANRIAVARLEGIVSEELAQEANKIRMVANKVLHSDPRLTGRTKDIIWLTVRIIYMIETGKDPDRPSF